jgi:hypothetical protein
MCILVTPLNTLFTIIWWECIINPNKLSITQASDIQFNFCLREKLIGAPFTLPQWQRSTVLVWPHLQLPCTLYGTSIHYNTLPRLSSSSGFLTLVVRKATCLDIMSDSRGNKKKLRSCFLLRFRCFPSFSVSSVSLTWNRWSEALPINGALQKSKWGLWREIAGFRTA